LGNHTPVANDGTLDVTVSIEKPYRSIATFRKFDDGWRLQAITPGELLPEQKK
jgi:hypothetical protein